MVQPSNSHFDLSESISQRLNAYALAAGAAGVGALALANPAEGKTLTLVPASHIMSRL